MEHTGRNDTCPCGSGLKYKKCCLPKHIGLAPIPVATDGTWLRMRRAEGELQEPLFEHMSLHYSADAIDQAWDEFTDWAGVPFVAEDYPEIESVFATWVLYSWVPDNAELDQEDWQPEMTIAEHYQQTMGTRLSSFMRQFIQIAVAAPFSYWQVLNCAPGKSITMRDLLRGGEVTVHERMASKTLKPGMVVYARVIAKDGDAIMLGTAPIPMPASSAQDILDFRQKLIEQGHPDLASSPDIAPKLTNDMLFEYDLELRSYYWDVRDALMNPAPPVLKNTDGETLMPIKLCYALSCTPMEALEALATLSLTKVKNLLQSGTLNEKGELSAIEFPWLKKGNANNKAWTNTVMGEIRIDGQDLVIKVNSEERATSIERRIAQRLRGRAVFVDSEAEPMEDVIARKQALTDPQFEAELEQAQTDNDALRNLPEVQQQMRRMSDQHWKDWLDMELPALHGLTPRQAAKTAIGRERLQALLTEFESRLSGDPWTDPDIAKLRRQLKLD